MQNSQHYILSFEKKLATVNAADITDQPYCKRYLLHLLQHKRYYLTIYTDVLKILLKHSRLQKEQIAVVDYGAGNGLLGLFAKHCGFGKIYINELDGSFLKAAQKLSLSLNININGFIKGDIDTVCAALSAEPPQAIIGTDIIEHIYNLDIFFNQLHQLNPRIISVFTTASNTANWYKTKQLKKMQLKDEYEGGSPEAYLLFGNEASKPFQVIRKEIIKEYFPFLSATENDILAIRTRGLNKGDIINATQKYLQDKILPALLMHPTNTCDPLSGSWTERLLTINEYQEIYNKAGFNISIYNGFYNQYYRGVGKSLLLRVANGCVKILGKYFSPFITLVGIGNNKNNQD